MTDTTTLIAAGDERQAVARATGTTQAGWRRAGTVGAWRCWRHECGATARSQRSGDRTFRVRHSAQERLGAVEWPAEWVTVPPEWTHIPAEWIRDHDSPDGTWLGRPGGSNARVAATPGGWRWDISLGRRIGGPRRGGVEATLAAARRAAELAAVEWHNAETRREEAA